MIEFFINTLPLTEEEESLVLVGVTYPNDLGYQPDDGMIYAIGNYQWNPRVWTILDKTFISFSDNSASNKYKIVVYDHFRNKVSNAIDTGLVAVGPPNDIHHVASMIPTADNKLLLSQASFHGPTAVWTIGKSEANYDINNFDPWIDTGFLIATYHQMKVHSDGDITSISRLGNSSQNYLYLELFTSTDNGDTFTNTARIVDVGASGDLTRQGAYPCALYSDDDVIRFFINGQLFVDPTGQPGVTIGSQKTFYLESHDKGTTWRNVDNTFSKDIVTNGAITWAELEANYVMWSLPLETDVVLCGIGQLIDGNPYFVGGSGAKGASPLALYYWSGSAWVQKVINISGLVLETGGPNNAGAIYKSGNDIHVICMDETSSGIYQMVNIKTSDNGDTWSLVKQYTSDEALHRNASTAYNNNGSGIVVCGRDTGVSYGQYNTHNLFIDRI
jgi:hypothetical protein